jgi:hypothetical protein
MESEKGRGRALAEKDVSFERLRGGVLRRRRWPGTGGDGTRCLVRRGSSVVLVIVFAIRVGKAKCIARGAQRTQRHPGLPSPVSGQHLWLSKHEALFSADR